MSTMPQRIYIGTSVLGKAGGGWATIIAGSDERRTLSGRAAVASVDDLGLRALIAGLAVLPPGAPVHVVTANQRLRDGLGGLLTIWARNGWRSSTGRELRNRALWEQVYTLTNDHPLAGAAGPCGAELPLANQVRQLAARAASR